VKRLSRRQAALSGTSCLATPQSNATIWAGDTQGLIIDPLTSYTQYGISLTIWSGSIAWGDGSTSPVGPQTITAPTLIGTHIYSHGGVYRPYFAWTGFYAGTEFFSACNETDSPGTDTVRAPAIYSLSGQGDGPEGGTGLIGGQIGLSSPSPHDVGVSYYTVPGTAQAGVDYTARSGRATISAGSTISNPYFTILSNPGRTIPRSFSYCLKDATNGDIDPQRTCAPITITVQPFPTLSVTGATVTRSTSTTVTTAVTVSLSKASIRPVSVAYRTQDATASANRDYIPSSGTLTFAPGETKKVVTLTVLPNETTAGEYFFLQLSGPVYATIDVGSATVGVSPAPFPTATAKDASVQRSATESTTVRVPVRLSPVANRTITIAYGTRNGSATAGQDYVTSSGTLTLQPGDSEAHVPLTVLAGVTPNAENLYVDLYQPSNVTLGRSTATVTVNPAPQPRASFTMSTEVGGRVTFDASASQPALPTSSIAKYTWTFGDGSDSVSSNSATATHTYNAPGKYSATLMVLDSTGTSADTGQQAESVYHFRVELRTWIPPRRIVDPYAIVLPFKFPRYFLAGMAEPLRACVSRAFSPSDRLTATAEVYSSFVTDAHNEYGQFGKGAADFRLQSAIEFDSDGYDIKNEQFTEKPGRTTRELGLHGDGGTVTCRQTGFADLTQMKALNHTTSDGFQLGLYGKDPLVPSSLAAWTQYCKLVATLHLYLYSSCVALASHLPLTPPAQAVMSAQFASEDNGARVLHVSYQTQYSPSYGIGIQIGNETPATAVVGDASCEDMAGLHGAATLLVGLLSQQPPGTWVPPAPLQATCLAIPEFEILAAEGLLLPVQRPVEPLLLLLNSYLGNGVPNNRARERRVEIVRWRPGVAPRKRHRRRPGKAPGARAFGSPSEKGQG
jgi:PKD repeat protein